MILYFQLMFMKNLILKKKQINNIQEYNNGTYLIIINPNKKCIHY